MILIYIAVQPLSSSILAIPRDNRGILVDLHASCVIIETFQATTRNLLTRAAMAGISYSLLSNGAAGSLSQMAPGGNRADGDSRAIWRRRCSEGS